MAFLKLMSKKCGDFKLLLSNIKFGFLIGWRSSKSLLILRIILSVTASIPSVIQLWIGKELLNIISITINHASLKGQITSFIQLLILQFFVHCIAEFIERSNEVSSTLLDERVSNYLDYQVMKKAATLDLSYFDSPTFYNEVTNSKRDSNAVQRLIWECMSFIRIVTQLTATLGIVGRLHWAFPLVILLTNIPAVLVDQKMALNMYNWMRMRVPKDRKMQYLMSILVSPEYAKEVRLFNLFTRMQSLHKEIWSQMYCERRNILLCRGIYSLILSVIPQITLIGTSIFTGLLVFQRKLTIGSFSLYTGAAYQLVNSCLEMIYCGVRIFEGNLMVTNFIKFINLQPMQQSYGKLSLTKPTEGHIIEFKNVSFKYPGSNKYVIQDFNLTIQPKEKLAIVGLNGSGKSTIAKLLLQLYPPTSGQIQMDGIDYRDYKEGEIQQVFSALFQDFCRYAFTIKENINLSQLSKERTDEYIINICSRAGLAGTIESLEKGIYSNLTRAYEVDGIELSGGQWQKLALARSLFRDPDFYILDEPTSNIDPQTERSIMEDLLSLGSEKGIVLISHRLQSLINVDRIIMLEDGKIVESGSHQQLLGLGGRYANLFNAQVQQYTQGSKKKQVTA